MKKRLKYILFFVFIASFSTKVDAQHSIARQWNEILLDAVRGDFARPTVHARNLFHCSAAMYDLWAVYDTIAKPFFLGNTVGGYEFKFEGVPIPQDVKKAREEAISYAMYRLLEHRFRFAPKRVQILAEMDAKFAELGYDKGFIDTDYRSGSPATLGNYLAQQIIAFGFQDGSNEQGLYQNLFYQQVNPPLVMAFPGNPDIIDINRWQPLTLDIFIDQSGNPIPFNTPPFLSPEWGKVVPFSLQPKDLTIYNRGGEYWVYNDPGPPPFNTLTSATRQYYQWGFSLVAAWSSHLDPSDGVMWDISPASIGNIDFKDLPRDIKDYSSFYDLQNGGDISKGYTVNPRTGNPYTPQIVPRADYARVLAEFWADGPASETPPGHWFTILNYVNDHPLFEKKYKGQGERVDDLEWDVKAYFILGGTMHDVAISAWGIKGWYDYVRPISAIRAMADLGQSSDPTLGNYNPQGILLIPGYIESVLASDPLATDHPENVGKIKLNAWKGPDYIQNPAVDEAGVDWILAEDWWSYQRPSFVTPPFAGYISGHSTYSRAAAEVMTMLTGDAFFPGGMGEFVAKKNEFLVFEEGPSVDVVLQWATYRDASDQTSLSRIWGGIHPPADDIPGRIIGQKIGVEAFAFAEDYFFVDADGDGYYYFEDCDDLNAAINPSIPETCDGVDNDCNGSIDDGLTTYRYFIDADGDGYGSPSSEVSLDTCMALAPMGYVTNSLDCDDSNAAINPGVQEVCDDIDNNCDGRIDEGLALFAYYGDVDGDGYGVEEDQIKICAKLPPAGYALQSGDCDDTNSSIYPGAADVPDNNIDEDCSGFDNVLETKLFPNPFRDRIMIRHANDGEYTLHLASLDQRVARTYPVKIIEKHGTVNLENIANGLYMIRLMDSDGIVVWAQLFFGGQG